MSRRTRPHAAACSLGLNGGAERLPTPRLRACPAGVRRNVALPPVSVRRHSSGLWEATLESTMGAMVVGARRCAHASRLCLVHTLGFPGMFLVSALLLLCVVVLPIVMLIYASALLMCLLVSHCNLVSKFRTPPANHYLDRNFPIFSIFCRFGQSLYKFSQNLLKLQIISVQKVPKITKFRQFR